MESQASQRQVVTLAAVPGLDSSGMALIVKNAMPYLYLSRQSVFRPLFSSALPLSSVSKVLNRKPGLFKPGHLLVFDAKSALIFDLPYRNGKEDRQAVSDFLKTLSDLFHWEDHYRLNSRS